MNSWDLSKRYLCQFGENQAKGSKDISILVKFHLFKSPRLPNLNSHKLVLVVHLCKFGENPSIDSRDILHTSTMTLKIDSKHRKYNQKHRNNHKHRKHNQVVLKI